MKRRRCICLLRYKGGKGGLSSFRVWARWASLTRQPFTRIAWVGSPLFNATALLIPPLAPVLADKSATLCPLEVVLIEALLSMADTRSSRAAIRAADSAFSFCNV